MKNKPITKILYPIIYLALVTTAYIADWIAVFYGLTLPWSIPLMILSGLILHVVDHGETFLHVGGFVGAVLNVLIYYFVYSADERAD